MKFLPQGGIGLRRTLAFFAVILFFTFAGAAQTTNGSSDAEIKGQELAQQLCETQPEHNLTNSGVMEIRGGHEVHANIPMAFEVTVTLTNWQSVYTTYATNHYLNGFRLPYVDFNRLRIIHTENQQSEYYWNREQNVAVSSNEELPKGSLTDKLPQSSSGSFFVAGSFGDIHITREELQWRGTKFFSPFEPSDFLAIDFGLEFFHWPDQKVIKHESRRTRDCTVLESTNPNPSPGGYLRVVSWIDNETHGIVHAEAYDTNNKLLKVFDPKSFKKVKGQWELKDMDIRNVQTGSKTRIEFNLDGKS